MVSRGRQSVLAAARRVGVEPQLRRAQLALASRVVRRNTRDDEHLALLLRLSLASDACCIDVGANVGAILTHMVDAAPQGQHIAFEPLPDLAAVLAARFPTVDVRAAALSRTPGERTFRRVVAKPSRSGFHEQGYDSAPTETLTVPVQSLDESLPAGYVPDVLKIDVEGAEIEVLEGGMTTICNARPTIALEHGGPPEASRRVYSLLVGEAGLRVFDLDGGGPMTQAEFVGRPVAGTHWNFLFHR